MRHTHLLSRCTPTHSVALSLSLPVSPHASLSYLTLPSLLTYAVCLRFEPAVGFASLSLSRLFRSSLSPL